MTRAPGSMAPRWTAVAAVLLLAAGGASALSCWVGRGISVPGQDPVWLLEGPPKTDSNNNFRACFTSSSVGTYNGQTATLQQMSGEQMDCTSANRDEYMKRLQFKNATINGMSLTFTSFSASCCNTDNCNPYGGNASSLLAPSSLTLLLLALLGVLSLRQLV